jgi:hypothetical protein
VPISSGGSKYLQIQEDGLVLLFGDIVLLQQTSLQDLMVAQKEAIS